MPKKEKRVAPIDHIKGKTEETIDLVRNSRKSHREATKDQTNQLD